MLLRFGCDPLIVNTDGKNALHVLMEKFGDDGWEFGMKDILMKAVDIMKIKRHKESKGGRNDDDSLSINSAVSKGSKLAMIKDSNESKASSKDGLNRASKTAPKMFKNSSSENKLAIVPAKK